MKERPITFTREMIQAERAGHKTVTRRLTGLHRVNQAERMDVLEVINYISTSFGYTAVFRNVLDDETLTVRSPYGAPGDRLYVKESLWIDNNYQQGLNWPTTFHVYAADEDSWSDYERHMVESEMVQWVPGRFMCKEMARTRLEVVDVRIERLNDITDEQALAEGIRPFTKDGTVTRYGLESWIWSYREPGKGLTMDDKPHRAFLQLFKSINKKAPHNPWVWVVTFKRLKDAPK